MKKETKKLLAYLLTLAIIVTTVASNSMIAQAATLTNNGTEISETTAPVEVSQNEEGQTVYSLTDNVTDGLELTLADGETAVLDGNGYTVSGRNAAYSNGYLNATPALMVTGCGTLIIENAAFQGGESYSYKTGKNGIVVSEDVNVILRETVTITAGSAGKNRTENESGADGNAGMQFEGKNLVIEKDSVITITGTPGYQGTTANGRWTGANGEIWEQGMNKGRTGGAGLIFSGEKLSIAGALTLNGGAGGAGISYIAAKVNGVEYYGEAGNGGSALSITKGVSSIEGNGSVSLNGGVSGNCVAVGYEGEKGVELEYQRGLFKDCILLGCAGLAEYEIHLQYPNTKIQAETYYVPQKDGITIYEEELTEASKKEGHTFEGWYADEACTETYDFASPVTGELTLYAKCKANEYTVSFNSLGGSEVESQTVSHNDVAKTPSTPEKEGYTFAGWYMDEACKETYDFASPVTGELILYAKWKLNEYTVSFNSLGGSEVETQTVSHNEVAKSPKEPTKEEHIFAGWYIDEACTESYDFATPVKGDITIYAKWSINKYTVSFNSLGGSEVEPQEVNYNDVAKSPQEPKKEGYTFAGWYTDEACTKSYDFATPVKGDITIYAKWN